MSELIPTTAIISTAPATSAIYFKSSIDIATSYYPQSSLPGDRVNECACSEESSSSVVIAVSAVSLLLIVTLATVILTQCLLIIRMRKSLNQSQNNGIYSEVNMKHIASIPLEGNKAYAPCTRREEATYEQVN